jgi:hypothetical protein
MLIKCRKQAKRGIAICRDKGAQLRKTAAPVPFKSGLRYKPRAVIRLAAHTPPKYGKRKKMVMRLAAPMPIKHGNETKNGNAISRVHADQVRRFLFSIGLLRGLPILNALPVPPAAQVPILFVSPRRNGDF